MRSTPLAGRLEEKTIPEPNTGCLLWLGGVNIWGYGQIKYRGRQLGAHRVAWEVANGPIPRGAYICHTCDVPLCVNPRHLYLGTATDNARDMVRRHRNVAAVKPHLMHCGERSGGSRLRLAEVKEIIAAAQSGVPRKVLAEQFGVDLSTIAVIVTGKSWSRALSEASTEDIEPGAYRPATLTQTPIERSK